MGAALKRHEGERTQQRHVRELKVVEGRGRARSSARSAASTKAFALVVVTVFCAFALVGLGRVWIASMATASTFRSSEIEVQLKNARAHSDELEITYSLLSRPDRIRVYAAETLQMGPAAEVDHIDLTPTPSETVAELPDSAFDGGVAEADMGLLSALSALLRPDVAMGADGVPAR